MTGNRRCSTSDNVLNGLLVASGHDDLAAFATLYDQTAPLVHGLVRSIVHDRTAAEQVTCNAYLHAWRTAPGYDPAYVSAVGRLLGAATWRLMNYGRIGFDGPLTPPHATAPGR
jgi:hypothetical protein